ncbi:MAG TPA: YchF/TatD family DNA exonuclease [Candidatus Krumholzibacteria bacterium]|nr:YchF/TatD family DNA exonuclease [Candidatus Krumholzibacteria bacterium]
MIDSHCHLNLEHFEDDRETTIARAINDGVTAFMNIGFDRPSLRATLELLEAYPFMFGAAGVHPHDAASYDESLETEVRGALEHPRMVAVGEIGLDFYRDIAPRDVQTDVFRKMIALSRDRHRPIVIHCRDAFNEVVETLISEGGTYKGIFHAFSAGEAEARSIFNLGFHVGIGGVVTYRNARLAETVAALPIERIVLETDSPYLTPHPWRGKRNEPAFVAHVLRTIARAKNMTVAEVDRITTRNYLDAMGLPSEALPPPVYKIGEALYIQSAAATPADLDTVAPEGVDEVILTGVVDPLDNLENTIGMATRARELGWHVRVNTSGFANQTAGRDLTPELAGVVQEIDVQLFGANPKQHDELAYPPVGAEGWEQIRDFVRCSVAAGIETICEFVATPGFDPQPCRDFTRALGARYDIRMYRS